MNDMLTTKAPTSTEPWVTDMIKNGKLEAIILDSFGQVNKPKKIPSGIVCIAKNLYYYCPGKFDKLYAAYVNLIIGVDHK